MHTFQGTSRFRLDHVGLLVRLRQTVCSVTSKDRYEGIVGDPFYDGPVERGYGN